MSFITSKTEPLVTNANLPKRLARALSLGIRSAKRRPMSPQLSYGRHAGPAPHTARAAAVMLLLFRRGDRWMLPLTERPARLARHAGQISLPGGSMEPGETTDRAALRELEEELGVGENVRLLGRLADCYVFASDFVITPWVAAIDHDPLWRLNAAEVAGLIELPLDHLLHPNSVERVTINVGPLAFHAPCFRYDQSCVWGATSVVLSELADVLASLVESEVNVR